jgi:hypothetical protein
MAQKKDDFYINEYKNARLNEGAILEVDGLTIKLIGK